MEHVHHSLEMYSLTLEKIQRMGYLDEMFLWHRLKEFGHFLLRKKKPFTSKRLSSQATDYDLITQYYLPAGV